jgi:predicted RNA-binding Zn ribbon-like protein
VARAPVFRLDFEAGVPDLVAFLNTRDAATGEDRLSSSDGTGRWLRDRTLLRDGEACDEALARRLRRVRTVLTDLLRAAAGNGRVSDAALEDLRRAVRVAPLRVAFDRDGGPRLEAGGPLGRIVALVLAARAEGAWGRLKVCRNPACGRVFVDRSRNRSRSWCAMRWCGNQAKARAHRRRQRAGAERSP